MKAIDITGHRYGRLVATEEAPKAGRRRRYRCKCDCGGEAIVMLENLRGGKTSSCGCLHKESVSASNSTHGKSGQAIYVVWRNMLARCFDESNHAYRHYGGRGISVCDEWRSFERFYGDMGDIPGPGMTIDRIDVNGDYTKANCRWATSTEQARNKTSSRIVEFQGLTCSLAEHCERLGADYKHVHRRLTLGWSVEKALTEPQAQEQAS